MGLYILLVVALAAFGFFIITLFVSAHMSQKGSWWGLGGLFLGFIIIPIYWFKFSDKEFKKYAVLYFVLLALVLILPSLNIGEVVSMPIGLKE